jgi:hypothetical protein
LLHIGGKLILIARDLLRAFAVFFGQVVLCSRLGKSEPREGDRQ